MYTVVYVNISNKSGHCFVVALLLTLFEKGVCVRAGVRTNIFSLFWRLKTWSTDNKFTCFFFWLEFTEIRFSELLLFRWNVGQLTYFDMTAFCPWLVNYNGNGTKFTRCEHIMHTNFARVQKHFGHPLFLKKRWLPTLRYANRTNVSVTPLLTLYKTNSPLSFEGQSTDHKRMVTENSS